MSEKPILCLDFDGVVHQYTSPWTDEVTISDHATDGFFEWAEKASEIFTLVIYSSRSRNPVAVSAMMDWLEKERNRWRFKVAQQKGIHVAELPLQFEFASEKPAAFLTIDDRAIQFDGNWSKLDPAVLIKFRPWNRKQ
jgi:hypothetical protein